MALHLFVDQSNDSIALQLYVELVRSVIGEIQIQTRSTGNEPVLKTGNKNLSGAVTIARYLARLVGDNGDFEQKNAVNRENSLHTAYIHQWVTFSQVDLAANRSATEYLDLLEQSISSTTYFVGNSVSLADIFLYVYLHETMLSLTDDQKQSYINLVRWFNLIQHHAPWSTGTAGVETEFFSLASVELNPKKSEFKLREFIEVQTPKEKPIQQQQQQPVKSKQENKEASTSKEAPKEAPKKGDAKASSKETVTKEVKKETPVEEPAKGSELNPHLIDIRVGKILSVERHSNADGLYVEKIDAGEEKPRTVCSGLVGKVEMADLQDKFVLIMANLKPSNMRGITSEAMLLCATDAETGKVELLKLPDGVKPGDRIQVDGYDKIEAEKQLNPKRFAKMIDYFKTDNDGNVTYNNHLLKFSNGTTPTSNFKNSVVK
jgi:aminoacyl tRNA synthase complex-interacting multifunctional protein 1